MKIKTITCHNVYNTGASLQAYALERYLKDLGHEVEIIDYVPDYLRHYRLSGVGNDAYDKPILREVYQLLKFPGRIKERYGKRKAEFDRFTREYLTLTKEHYDSYEQLCANPPEADLVFAGSDQIWNTLFENGKDPAFYLQFLPKQVVRASYAASFASPCVAEGWSDTLKNWLSTLNYISVREQNGLKILNDLGLTAGVQVMDPVFLLPSEEWNRVAGDKKFKDKYIFLYDFDKNSKFAAYARKLARDRGWKVYSFLENPYADKCLKKEGPEGFLSLIRHSEMVLSNSFHATAFSIIFEKQFLVFERVEEINTRMQDLLEQLDLSERLVTEINDQVLNSPIEYSKVTEKLEREINRSKAYIHQVLSEVKNNDAEEKNFVCD